MFTLEQMDSLVHIINLMRPDKWSRDLTIYSTFDFYHWYFQIEEDSVPSPIYKYPRVARIEISADCDEYEVADIILDQLMG